MKRIAAFRLWLIHRWENPWVFGLTAQSIHDQLLDRFIRDDLFGVIAAIEDALDDAGGMYLFNATRGNEPC